MRGHRLTRPHRADLAGRVVADREDEVEPGCARLGELVPVLAAQTIGRHPVPRQQLERERIHPARRMGARAEGAEASGADLPQDGLRHDAARGVAGAEKQDVERASVVAGIGHDRSEMLNITRSSVPSPSRAISLAPACSTSTGGFIGLVAVEIAHLAERVIALPGNPLRIGHPMLVGPRVAAARARFVLQRRLVRGSELLANAGQLVGRFGLQAEMVDAGLAAASRDREIDARIFDHPLGVVVLADRGRRAEQAGIETDALLEVGDPEVDVKALHADFLLRRVGNGAATGRGAPAGTHAASQTELARQQFSVR